MIDRPGKMEDKRLHKRRDPFERVALKVSVAGDLSRLLLLIEDCFDDLYIAR